MKLEDKVIVITGSTRGIGRAIAETCAKEGAKVVICSRQESAVKETCETFKQQDLNVSRVTVDVSIQSDLEKLLQHTIETWGRVDVWINNAGLSGGLRPLNELSEEEITRIIDVNFAGTLKACRIIIPYFIQQGGGILINVSGRGYGRGRGGQRQGTGGPSYCVCPKCGYKASHVRGTPCLSTKCPKCGTSMMPSS